MSRAPHGLAPPSYHSHPSHARILTGISLCCSSSLRRSRKLLETDFFARAEAKGLLPPSAQKWNLGSLSFFILFVDQRLKVKTGAGGRDVYGNLKDGADAIAEVESICEWLMDPIACPTTWHVLLTIRQQNPHYGVAPPAVA